MVSDPFPGNRIRGVDSGVVGSGIDSGCRCGGRLLVGSDRRASSAGWSWLARGCWRSMVNVSLSAGAAVDHAWRPGNGSGRDDRVGNGAGDRRPGSASGQTPSSCRTCSPVWSQARSRRVWAIRSKPASRIRATARLRIVARTCAPRAGVCDRSSPKVTSRIW